MLSAQHERLSNGLLVITRQSRSAPVVAAMLWYRVGSRYERPGKTGISHWVEHMLFKGTPDVPRGTFDRLIARNGGVFNGFTSLDYTAFYETLPADRVELALRIEADRMANALFDPLEVEAERSVILTELEGRENHPETWLNQAVNAAAFQRHPYRNPVIGHRDDLAALTSADLYAYYRRYYVPGNAVLVLVGDLKTDTAVQLAEQYFGALPPGPAPELPELPEPPQEQERRVLIRRPGAARYLRIAYRAVDCRSPDYVPMLVLDAVLSGPKGVGGAARTSRSARLYRALVETELATEAYSGFSTTHDPFLFDLSATLCEHRSVEQVERALLAEVERIQQDGVQPTELARIAKQVRAQLAFGSESVTSQASQLGRWEMLDSYRRAETLLDEIAGVSAEQVRRVAQTYLTARNRTIGIFIPDEG